MRILFIVTSLLLPFLDLPAESFTQATEEIIEAGVFLNRLGLCPATSGNLSRRLDEEFVAVTTSGKHKGKLSSEDIVIVDLKGRPQGDLKKPLAETLLHTAIYALFKETGAVLHTHSLNGTVLTRLMPFDTTLVTEGYEIHKVFHRMLRVSLSFS